MVSAKLRFIEPQLASPVDQPPEGKHWFTKSSTMATALRWWSSAARRMCSAAMDMIGATAIVRAAANLRCKSAII